MKHKYSLIFTLLIGFAIHIKAQITEGGFPYSFLVNTQLGDVQTIQIPSTPIDELRLEDVERDKQKSLPYRFGYNHYVNLNKNNCGNFLTLANGDKLWQLIIHSPNAVSLNLTFGKYHLPEGAKLFIYSQDKSEVIGALTKRNNQEDGKLGCTLIAGNTCVVEYYEPANAEFEGELQIWRVTHGYRSLKDYSMKTYGDAGSCNNNINCPIGAAWQNEKRSVACIVVNGNESCTGTLINNACEDGTPYFLTANHCTVGEDVSTWVFRFNWESATCTNANGPMNQTISGATLKANNLDSDFALLLLSSAPPQSYNAFYAGWSNIDVPADSAVCIHHPSGDIKKISFAPGSTTSAVYDSHMTWQTAEWFDGLLNGATEPGSSGSPLFDTHHRIVGQLYGGPSSCTAVGVDRIDYYGKFAASWDSGATPATRLKDWLDPQNTGITTIDGINYVAPLQYNIGVASIITPNISTQSCSLTINPSIQLNNFGTTNITSATISYKIDNGSIATYNWTGTLNAGSNVIVNLPAIQSPSSGTHAFTAFTTIPNGILDSASCNDANSTSFSIVDPNNAVSLPFLEDFNFTTFPGNGWQVINPDSTSTTWAFQGANIVNAPGSVGKSLRMRNKLVPTNGQLDYAVTPFYNFANQYAPLYMTFYHGYAKYNLQNDSLIVAFTSDCGATYNRLKGFSANDLSLNSGGSVTSAQSFIPNNDSLWVLDSINISAVAGLSGVRFAFISKSDLGNSLFIDAININENKESVQKLSNHLEVSFYPNPTSDILNINFQKKGNYTISLKNILGKEILQMNTSLNTKIETSALSKGIYFIDVSNKQQHVIQKVVLK